MSCCCRGRSELRPHSGAARFCSCQTRGTLSVILGGSIPTASHWAVGWKGSSRDSSRWRHGALCAEAVRRLPLAGKANTRHRCTRHHLRKWFDAAGPGRSWTKPRYCTRSKAAPGRLHA
eukprot:1677134-Rhodomonas_salina.1